MNKRQLLVISKPRQYDRDGRKQKSSRDLETTKMRVRPTSERFIGRLAQTLAFAHDDPRPLTET